MATASQSPDPSAAQEASISTDAEHTAQEGPGQTTQSGAEKSAATLPQVFLRTGETKHSHNLADLVMFCTALQHIVLAEKISACYALL